MSTLNKASDVAAEITARMGQVSIANGFNTDVGLRVLRGRRRIDDGQVPCIVIAEGLDQVTASPGRIPSAEIQQTYILIAYHECHPDHPNDKAHELLKDLKRAVFKDGVTLGGKVHRIDYRGRDIGPRGDGVGIVCASIEVEVKFVEDLTNP
jgi:hypothetical protein